MKKSAIKRFGDLAIVVAERISAYSKVIALPLLLTYSLIHYLHCEPFRRDSDTEWAYKSLQSIATLSGETLLWKNAIQETPTRLDLAVFLNHCLVICEEKDIEVPNELLSPLLKEFDRELLLLDIQNRLQNQDSYLKKIRDAVSWNLEFSYAAEQMSGDFPITARELVLYGAPPPTSVISLSQQTRLKLTAGSDNTFAFVCLKNFGYWGIGKYSSGASGINFSSSDPPSVEEVMFQTGNRTLSLSIGRRYVRLGKYGLSVDYLITPLESIQFSGKWKALESDIIVGSRFDSADYYAVRVGAGPFGIIGFISSIKREYRTQYNLINDKGVGADLSFNFLGRRRLLGEYSCYKPSEEDAIHSWVAGLDVIRTKNLGLLIQYGDLGNVQKQTVEINRLPLEFINEKFLRFQSNSRGPNLILNFNLPYRFNGDCEFLYMDKKIDSEILRRYTVRFSKIIFENSYFILEDFYTTEDSLKYNTARGQIVFNF
ncbi:MAG: hypothetical protein HY919_03585 [Elusimicrobia bacterium]|nr:hypothetical protein [Elusimicrobiota bacterium]